MGTVMIFSSSAHSLVRNPDIVTHIHCLPMRAQVLGAVSGAPSLSLPGHQGIPGGALQVSGECLQFNRKQRNPTQSEKTCSRSPCQPCQLTLTHLSHPLPHVSFLPGCVTVTLPWCVTNLSCTPTSGRASSPLPLFKMFTPLFLFLS